MGAEVQDEGIGTLVAQVQEIYQRLVLTGIQIEIAQDSLVVYHFVYFACLFKVLL